VTVLPSIDAIAEMKVTSANAESDTGFGNAGQIDISIKSGTKQFHGVLYEFLRNDAFDANNYFANLAGQPKPELRYNNFGYNIGGPIYLPKVSTKSNTKLFFFFNQEWRKLRQGQQFYAQAPPAAWRTGDFSSLVSCPGDNISALSVSYRSEATSADDNGRGSKRVEWMGTIANASGG